MDISQLSVSELLALAEKAKSEIGNRVARENAALETAKNEIIASIEAIIATSENMPEEITISVALSKGKVTASAVKRGGGVATMATAGRGRSADNGSPYPTPAVGSICCKTYKGVQHTLEVREGDFLLDGQTPCGSPTWAYKMILGDPKASVDGRKYWFAKE